MKITIDVGNQNIKIYDLDKEDTCVVFNDSINAHDEIESYLVNNNIKEALISSVVPEVSDFLSRIFIKNKIKFQFIQTEVFGQLIDFNNLPYQEMGSDRVVTSYAALNKYGDNVIIFDLGTAVTLDVLVDKKYISGLIFPGLKLLQRSIVTSASELYDFKFQPLQSNKQCVDTISQLNDGIVYGFLGMLKEYVNVAKDVAPKDSKIIMTGGTVNELLTFITEEQFYEMFKREIIIDTKLMELGLQQIYYYLKENNETE